MSPKTIPTRPLGNHGPLVPRLGLGLMGASGTYGMPAADAERLAFLDKAYEMGERFWDSGMFIMPSSLDYGRMDDVSPSRYLWRF
jgi:hypothetical protein